MKRTIISLIGLLASLTGCDMQISGLRRAPTEEQKQSAQASDDLGKGGAWVGFPPGSAAATILAKSTTPARAYAGEPKHPVDVGPLIAAAAGTWEAKQQQIAAWKLKKDLYARAGEITAAAMADLAELVRTKKKINSAEIVQRVGAIVGFSKMTAEFTQEIPVPGDKQISDSDQAVVDAITAQTDRINAIAGDISTDRVTAGEVSEKLREGIVEAQSEAQEWITLAKEYTPWVLGVLGLGGVGYAAKKGKQSRKDKADADTARHDEANARHREQMVKADAADVLTKAMEHLAAAQPPVVSAAEPPKTDQQTPNTAGG